MTGAARASLLIIAAIAFALYVVLGIRVDGQGPLPIDRLGFALRGHAIGIAWFFTQLGLTPFLVAFSAAAALSAVRNQLPITPVVALFATQAISQAVLAYGKHAFNRARPGEYFGPHLPDLSYASGHAATAVVFYIGLAVLAGRSALAPRTKVWLACALSVVALAVMWSRLALGAHYLSDVAGGAAFGAGWLALSLAAWPAVDALLAALRRRYASKRISAG